MNENVDMEVCLIYSLVPSSVNEIFPEGWKEETTFIPSTLCPDVDTTPNSSIRAWKSFWEPVSLNPLPPSSSASSFLTTRYSAWWGVAVCVLQNTLCNDAQISYCLNDAILLECKPLEGRVTCSLLCLCTWNRAGVHRSCSIHI